MKQLPKLLASNRGKGQFRAEKAGDEATMYLYDVIVSDAETAAWMGGVDPLTFAKALAGLDASTIHLRINCPGGDVFAARAMEQAIREHPATIIAHVDGYAASAASYLALAADEVVIAEGGFFMIHKAWTFAWGNADDLVEMAALLDKIDGSLVASYAKETGQESARITEWMAAETWFNAEEAVANGFADRIAEQAPKAKAAAAWDLSAYAHPPAPAPEAHATPNTDHLRRRLDLVAGTA